MQEEPETADGEETVILARLSDRVEAGSLRELLEAEGIAVSTPGLGHRALLGIAGGYVDIVVRVPKKDRDKAQELLDGLRTPSPPVDERPGDAVRTNRTRRVAVFAALILTFGAGHFYARRNAAGAILLALEVACIALAFVAPLFVYAIPAIALADALGAVLLIGADQRGTRARFGTVPGPALAALAVGFVPAMLGLAPRTLAGPDAVHACAIADRCGSPEDAEACIDRAAGRTFYGTGSLVGDRACVECLEREGCARALDACACGPRVQAWEPPADTSHGPLGTRPEDMQLVVPDLFRHDDEGPPPIEIEDMLRTLEALPPPPTTGPFSPAHP